MIAHYLHNLTWARLSNLLRSRWSYFLSRFGIVRVSHSPCFISFEPADWCMLRCPECPVGIAGPKRERHLPDPELFRALLDRCADRLHTVQFFFQGEPLLNPHLPELIAEASRRGIVTVVSTNAQLLDRSLALSLAQAGLHRLIVSVDGLTQESYASYRIGGSLDKALRGLRYMAEAKRLTGSRMCIELQCLRLRTNQHEWKRFTKEYRSLGADLLVFKTAQLADFGQSGIFLPDNLRYGRYILRPDGTWRRRKPYRNRCRRIWSGCVVDAQGRVLPCCFDKDASFCFGSLHETDLLSLWHSPQADAFRHSLITARSSIPMCANCTE